MMIEQGRASDWDALKRIWLRSFSDGPEFWDWLRGEVWQPERTLVLREGGRVVSCLLLLPCVFSGTLRAQYVYAVATDPEFRGGGRMAGVLREAERRGRAQGLDLSVLLTEEDSLQGYYARFGYLPLCVAAERPLPSGAGCGARRAMREDDLPAVGALYEEACRQFGRPCALRDQTDLRRELALYTPGAEVCERDGALSGYCFYDERGVAEAAGPDGAALAAQCAPEARVCLTVPARGEHGKPLGCALALSERGARALADGPVYLNMMFN